jgi:peroxiredoxin
MRPEPRRRPGPPIFLFITGGLLLVFAIGLLLVNSVGALQLDLSPGSSSIEPARIGQPLSNFSLQDLHGETVHLSDYSGQVILINAWAIWCPPCVAEMPDLQAFYQTHRTENFTILGINAGDPPSKAAAFVSQQGITFPILFDPNVELLTRLGVDSFPTSILIDRDGIVRSIHIGMYTAEDLDAAILPYLR